MKTVQFPPFVHWEVTPECNHNCIHCYNYWRKDAEKLESLRTVFDEEHYLKIANKLVEQKAHTVVITGGEPLLVFDKVQSSIELFKANKINVSINTNAALITDEIISFVKKHDISLFISFPCCDEEVCDFITNRKGSLKRILRSLDKLTLQNVRFSLNIVASKANIDYLQDTVDFLRKRYNIKKIYITRVGKPVNSDDSFDKYLLSYDDLCRVQDVCVKTKFEYGIDVDTGCPFTLCSINSQKSFELFGYKKFCTAGKTSYSVDTFGNVKACPRDSTIYGNILEEDFSAIWERISEWRDGSLLPEECQKCSMKEICKGGCRVDAFPFTGRLDSMDTSARTCNLPIKYHKAETPIGDYTDVSVFIVNPFRCVEEEFGYRISYKQAYVFATKELKDYLCTHTCFTRPELMRDFSVDSATATMILSRLSKNGIIYLTRR